MPDVIGQAIASTILEYKDGKKTLAEAVREIRGFFVELYEVE